MTILDEFHDDDRRVLDRLVDGELGVDERRELLAALDDEPAGWRRCALAFLEAQAWRLQLSRLAAEPLVAQLSAPAKPATSAGRASRWLAIAASLLAAFGLGAWVSRHEVDPAATVVRAPSEESTQAAPREHASQRPVAAPAVPRPDVDGDGSDAAGKAWQMLTLTPLDGDGSEEPLQVRLMDDTVDDPAQLVAGSPPIASALIRGLEQDGWEVDRRQQLVPIELSDGRQVVVPIEEVDLRSPQVVQF